MKPYFLILLVIIAIGIGFLVFRQFSRNEFDLPQGGETITETIVIQDRGVSITKEIMITDGVKHSIPLDELIGGGPPKDGIPSIDNPKFVSVQEANKWLGDKEPGIVFSRGNTHRFYPYQILVWHEIVNDIVPALSGVEGEGERVLVTYCPLCFTGFVLDPLVQGERVEFGTSGLLWKSNLVMYDRKTDSLWPQVLAEAVVGEMTGTKLKILPSDQARYGEWKKLHLNGEVLSRDIMRNGYVCCLHYYVCLDPFVIIFVDDIWNGSWNENINWQFEYLLV